MISSFTFELWHCFGQPQISSGTWKARPADAKVESHLLEHLRHLSCRSVYGSPQPKCGPIYTYQCQYTTWDFFYMYCCTIVCLLKMWKVHKMTLRAHTFFLALGKVRCWIHVHLGDMRWWRAIVLESAAWPRHHRNHQTSLPWGGIVRGMRH